MVPADAYRALALHVASLSSSTSTSRSLNSWVPVLKLIVDVLGKKKVPIIVPFASVSRRVLPPRAVGYSRALEYSLPNSCAVSENLEALVSCRTQSLTSLPPKNANILVLGRSPLTVKLILRERMNGIISTSAICSPIKSCTLRVVSLKEMSLGMVVNNPVLLKLFVFLPSRRPGATHKSASKSSNRRTVVCIIGGRERVSTHSSDDGDSSMCPVCVITANGFTFNMPVARVWDIRLTSVYGSVTMSPCFSTALTLSVL